MPASLGRSNIQKTRNYVGASSGVSLGSSFSRRTRSTEVGKQGSAKKNSNAQKSYEGERDNRSSEGPLCHPQVA